MKILHVTQNYYPSLGGTQYMMKKIGEVLHERYSDDVTVFTSNSYYGPNSKRFKRVVPADELLNGVQVKRFPFIRAHKPLIQACAKLSGKIFNAPLPELFQSFSHGPLSFRLNDHIAFFDADVICASSVHYLFADYPLWRYKKRTAKPFVLYGALHLGNGCEIPSFYLRRIQRADYYIANTAYEKECIIAAGIDDEKVVVIGVAVDVYHDEINIEKTILKNKYNISDEEIVILCLSRQEVHKGLPVFIEAVKLLQHQEKRLKIMIAGATGSYTPVLKVFERESAITCVLCDVTEIEKKELLHISDIVVLPSSQESFGVTFLEGWSFKKPVIGARIGAIASVISDNHDGLLFEHDNAGDLTGKITQLLNSESLRNKMGEEGYEKVIQNYTWEIVAEKFRKVYEMAIEKFNQSNLIKNSDNVYRRSKMD